MRYFPGAAHPRLLTAALAGVMTTVVLALPAPPVARADDDLDDRAEDVRGQVAGAVEDLDEASEQVSRTARELAAARRQLTRARAEEADIGARLDAARARGAQLAEALEASEARLATAAEKLGEGRRALEEQQEEIAASVRSSYAQGDPQLLAVGSLMSATTAEDLTRQLALEQAIVDKETRVFDDLGDAEARLAAHKQKVQRATDAVADRRDQAAATVDRVAALYDRAGDARARVAGLVDTGREARAAALEARRRDEQVLAALRGREARIRDQILEATSGDTGGVTGAGNGFLSYPADAPVTSPYGYRIHPIYGYRSLHNGTDFGVPCGASLAASADGTVLDTYYDEVYGRRLFLSVGNVNGQNMTLVYNHLSSYAVGEGARVQRGQTIGYGGTTGWSTGCHLHFTVLLDGTPVDPMTYL